MNPLAHALFFQEERVLVDCHTHQYLHPVQSLLHSHQSTSVPFFALTQHIYTIQLPQEFNLPAHFKWIPIRELLLIIDETDAKLICRGKQLIHWHCNSLFCGKCGATTQPSRKEICKICPACNNHIYPSTSPAIIVLIQKEDFILLGRSPHFPPALYSTLAGFIDPSENCEDAVIREIEEEVGLQVKNIRYFGSQSWPFPNSFMLGFLVDYATGEIKIDPNEIEDAQWFHKTNLPLIPPPYSISRQMIDHFIGRKISTSPHPT